MGPLLTLAPSGPGLNVLIATNWHVQTWASWQGQNCTPTGPIRAKKKEKKKKTELCSDIQTKHGCMFFFVFFLIHSQCHGVSVNIGPVWPRAKRADCYQTC